ncbi:MAG: TonB-dependent receptor [Chloracidobacterium sp.]|nr:TonB-dependent receptor [Chloracidobacterium sp.]
MKFIRSVLFLFLITGILTGAALAQATGSIAGQVVDGLGAIVVGATVTAVAADGKEKQVVTNARGEYSIGGLAPGKYAVKAIAPKFALYDNTEVMVTSGERNELSIVLTVAGLEESVDVSNENKVTTDADNNANATVIKGKDLEALPDDPDELQAALQALAGAAAGPNGGQIYIDGFTGGQLPAKDAIREIRINQNPFSAEFDRLGFGRIEILTKPGSDKWRGQAFMNFNDESLNSRNPFANNRAPSQTKFFGGSVSGPIKQGKSSFSLDINNRNIDNNAIINAQILTPSNDIVNLRRDVRVPNERLSITPRLDYSINAKNTLVARYSFSNSAAENQGIGDTSLPSRAYTTSSREHEVRLTETMIINSKTVNETRFEYSDSKREQDGDNTIPTINVASAFVGGGAQIGLSFNRNKTWEINNYTSTSFGKNSQHSFKFGGKLRHVSLDDRSENNFGGTFVFPGFPGTGACDIDFDGFVSSIEQYRCKVMGTVGLQYNPTQFTITAGEPLSSVSQYETGLYLTDDWKVSPALLLSFGLRYENQTNISSKLNFAPRFGFAYSPGAGGARAPKTVFRGGAGIFYDRFSENLTLQATRFDGVTQLNLVVNANDPDPVRQAAAIALLAQPVFTQNGVTNVPTAAQIQAVLPQSNTIRQVADNLQVPYTMQATIGIERQLPGRTTVAGYFITSRILHQLRSRNINAPICPLQEDCSNSPRPEPTLGNLYEYESSGTTKQNQLIVNFRTNLNTKYSFFGNYRLGFAKGDTDGAGSFPAYTFDLTGEYGRSSFDIRHSFVIGGNITMPWNVTLNPFIIAQSGRPFNITEGNDINRDALFTERPTYGQLQSRCSELNLTSSFCNIGSNDPNAIIPRNYGVGPSYFSVNMRVGRNFGFGHTAQSPDQGGGSGGNRRGGQAGGGGIPSGGMGGGGMTRGGGPGGGGMFGGGGDTRKPYNLNVGINFTNLFNSVNFSTPVGALNSSRFGQSVSTAGGFGGFGGGGFGGVSAANRRIELQMRFSW